MADEKIVPTWGYKGSKAQIFQLKEGESLPSGWSDSPAATAEKPRRGRKAKVEAEAEDDSEAEDDLSEDESEDDGEDSQ